MQRNAAGVEETSALLPSSDSKAVAPSYGAVAVVSHFHNKWAGHHLASSPVVGSRLGEARLMSAALEKHAELRLLNTVIHDANIYVIPAQHREAANAIALKMFSDYIAKYSAHGFTVDNIVYWNEVGYLPQNITSIRQVGNGNTVWHVRVCVEKDHGAHEWGQKKNQKKFLKVDLSDEWFFLPPHVVAYHELMHAEETEPGKDGAEFKHPELRGIMDAIEIMTSIKSHMLLDEIYKKVHGIDINAVVDYPHQITLRFNNRDISMGEFANFYRGLEKSKGGLCKAILSDESLAYLGIAKVAEAKTAVSPLRQFSAVAAAPAPAPAPAVKKADDDCCSSSCLSSVWQFLTCK